VRPRAGVSRVGKQGRAVMMLAFAFSFFAAAFLGFVARAAR
jgi:hypothetical protein